MSKPVPFAENREMILAGFRQFGTLHVIGSVQHGHLAGCPLAFGAEGIDPCECEGIYLAFHRGSSVGRMTALAMQEQGCSIEDFESLIRSVQSTRDSAFYEGFKASIVNGVANAVLNAMKSEVKA